MREKVGMLEEGVGLGVTVMGILVLVRRMVMMWVLDSLKRLTGMNMELRLNDDVWLGLTAMGT